MKKKQVLKFRVSNANILLRFNAQKLIEPGYTLEKMAEQFGAIDKHGNPLRAVAWRWTKSDKYPRTPNQTYKCPKCHQTQFDNVEKWLNDGILG